MNFRIWLLTVSFLAAFAPVATAQQNHWLAVGHGGQRMLSTDVKTWVQVGSWS